jgi:hypothetical protein
MAFTTVDFVDVSAAVVDSVVLLLYHRMFPNGGNWSRFVNPFCGRTAGFLGFTTGRPHACDVLWIGVFGRGVRRSRYISALSVLLRV